MIEIRAKLVSDRISLSRAGSRARRQPTIVLGTGAVIKLSPGRSIRVTEEVYEANKALLDNFKGMIEVKGLPEPTPLPNVEETATHVEPVAQPVEVEVAQEDTPTPVVDEVIEVVEEVQEEPQAPIEEKPKPAPKRRKRRTKAEIEADKKAKALAKRDA